MLHDAWYIKGYSMLYTLIKVFFTSYMNLIHYQALQKIKCNQTTLTLFFVKSQYIKKKQEIKKEIPDC